MVVLGDERKYLTCLIALKCQTDNSGKPTPTLDKEAISFCQKTCPGVEYGCIEDVKNSADMIEVIERALERANAKAPANPQKVQKFFILPLDFSIQGGELGPTMKMKRHFIAQKYKEAIDKLYAS